MLSEGYAVIVRVGVILFLDELFWVLLHRGLPVYLVPVQSATSEQRNLVAVLHGTRPGSWTPFLQFVLEREAGACGRLRQDRYDFFATFSSLRRLLCKFDRAALDVLLLVQYRRSPYGSRASVSTLGSKNKSCAPSLGHCD